MRTKFIYNTLKRCFDIMASLVFLILAFPFFIFAAVGIILTSPGPIFYHAPRCGKNGRIFSMYKFRSMQIGSETGSPITAQNDSRVFRFGTIIRLLKIDEIPQFLNILKGDMSIVGPRPEDPTIVEKHYSNWMHETLSVRPGVTSPGAIFGYAYAESLLDPDLPADISYVNNVLQPKLALERTYIDRSTLILDIGYIFLTIAAIVMKPFDITIPPLSKDTVSAKKWSGSDEIGGRGN